MFYLFFVHILQNVNHVRWELPFTLIVDRWSAHLITDEPNITNFLFYFWNHLFLYRKRDGGFGWYLLPWRALASAHFVWSLVVRIILFHAYIYWGWKGLQNLAPHFWNGSKSMTRWWNLQAFFVLSCPVLDTSLHASLNMRVSLFAR